MHVRDKEYKIMSILNFLLFLNCEEIENQFFARQKVIVIDTSYQDFFCLVGGGGDHQCITRLESDLFSYERIWQHCPSQLSDCF